MSMDILKTSLRPEVKGAFVKDDTIYLATLAGLYRWAEGKMNTNIDDTFRRGLIFGN